MKVSLAGAGDDSAVGSVASDERGGAGFVEVSHLGSKLSPVGPRYGGPRFDNPHRRRQALRVLSDLGYQHEYFIGAASTLPAHVFLPGVHLIASLLKRSLTGTLHYAASQDHLDYYLDGVHLPLQLAHLESPRPAVL